MRHATSDTERSVYMNRNLGKLDQFIRIVAGLAIFAFLFKDDVISPACGDPDRDGIFLVLPALHVLGVEYGEELQARLLRGLNFTSRRLPSCSAGDPCRD